MAPTHSPDLLNTARLEEFLWLVKKDGLTRSIRNERDSSFLEEESAKALWKQLPCEGI
jgi:hypothetical protein